MNQVPRVTAGNDTKKFWSKVKQSSKGFSSSFGNLSLHSEHDGSTETDTLVHKAMVNYYSSKNLPYPTWLGVPDRNNQPSVRHSNKSPYQQQEAQQRPSYQQQQRGYDNTGPQTSTPARRTNENSNSKYSLSDIYNKSSSDLRSTSQAQQQRFGMPARSQTFNSSHGVDKASTAQASAGYGGPRANSTASNRLKERSQRLNKTPSHDSFGNQSASNSSFASGTTITGGSSNSSSGRTGATWRRN